MARVVTQNAVLVGGYKPGKLKDATKPDGDRWAESLQYIDQDPEHGGVRSVELSPAINGDRPAQGEVVKLVLDYFPRRCKQARRDGTLYDSLLFHPVVVGFAKAA